MIDPEKRTLAYGTVSGDVGNGHAPNDESPGPVSAAGAGRRYRAPSVVLVLVAIYIAVSLPSIGNLRNIGDFDEGVYLALIRAVAGGSSLYRDVGFIHPPFLIWLLAPVFKATGSVAAVRFAYACIGGLALPPLYRTARHLTDDRCARFACVVYITSPALCDVLARRVYTDVPAVVCETWALRLLLVPGDRPKRSWFLAGAILGIGTGFRLAELFCVVAFSIGLTAAQGRRSAPSVLWLLAGYSSVALPLLVSLSWIKGFLYCITVLPFGGDRTPMAIRLWKVLHLIPADPLLMLFGWRIFAGRVITPAERFLAGTSLALLVLSVVPYTSFFPRYILPLFPLLTVQVAAAFRALFESAPASRMRTIGRGAFLFASVVQILGLFHSTVYRQPKPPEQRRLLEMLSAGAGCLYTGDPIWAVEAGRPLTPGYYACDPRAPVLSHAIGPADFDRNLDAAETVLLDPGLAGDLSPRNHAHLRQDFRFVVRIERWQLWEHHVKQ